MSLFEVKQKISSIIVIKKITRAMQLVATVKFQKAEIALKNQDAYFSILEQIVGDIFGRMDAFTLQRMFHKDKLSFKKRLIVIVTSDLGFCGGFNYNIVCNLLTDYNREFDQVVVFGKKGKFMLDRYEIKPLFFFENSRFLHEVLDIIIPNLSIYYEYIHNDYRDLIIIYNKYISPSNIKTVRHSAWPIKPEEFQKNMEHLFKSARPRTSDGIPIEMIFEPNRIEVAREVFPNYLLIFLYSCLVNSFVSENAMRQSAMDNANRNCEELLEELTLKWNIMRQASITQEILEVISSYNA